ncbi:zinc-binding dehydrogenase [Oceanobacillus sp. Castelsardo]|uniref:zinc-dependent alcohol dehydrogenase n=1 Tax=Oceanobacillus sp. Castelsardo TaxID=1851204 RepID=UPI0008385448|nr:zinc-binding dehydrogenase [Oceanobacillus sp. Castelsardo]
MKALVKKGPGEENIGLEQLDKPSAGESEVLVKVHATGICGTDVHILKDEYPANYPVALGHEYSGYIEEVGSKITNFKKGDRVVSHTAAVTCGNCYYCKHGLLMLCEERKSIGSGVNGAFAEYVVVPAELTYKIPENISMDEAALSEPLACIVRSVIERATVKAGDSVIVSGPGTIGLLTQQVVQASGGNVTVVGTSQDRARLELAKELGAMDIIVVDDEREQEKLQSIMGTFDVAFECSGVAPSADNCLHLLKKTGLYVQVGLFGKKILFDHDLALMKEINITNSYASEPTSWVRALQLLESEKVNVKPLISNKLPLEEWEKGFDIVMNKGGFKVLLEPNE